MGLRRFDTPGEHPHSYLDCAHQFGHRVGRRGAYLMFLAALDIVTGFALLARLPPGLTQAILYEPFERIMPLKVWAAWWVAAGVLAGVASLLHPARPLAFGVAACLKVGWALGYFIGWVEQLPFFVRGYQTSILWLGFASITLIISGWRENGK